MIKWKLDACILKDSGHRRTPVPVVMLNIGRSVLQPK